MGSFRNGHFKLYESRVHAESGLNIKVESKYSHLETKDLTGLDMNSYEDDSSFGEIKGHVKIESKYSDFIFGDAQDVDLTLYESDIEMKKSQKIQLDSKYSNVEMGDVHQFHISRGYEDKIRGANIDDFIAEEAKYCKYSFNQLNGTCKLGGYETSLEINHVAASFKELWVDSKYDHVHFPIPASVSYALDVEMKYGKIDYSKDAFSKIEHTKKNEQIIIKSTPEKDTGAKVYIRGYETDFVLKQE
jgi:paraquat-inducible protein B